MPAISFLPFLRTIPPGTRILTSVLILSTISAWFLSAYIEVHSEGSVGGSTASRLGKLTVKVAPWLVLQPGESYVYPWTLVTAPWIEGNVIELIVSATTLVLATKYLERIWGFKELIRFSLITVVVSNVIAFGFSWIAYTILGQEDYIYGTPYHGLSALQIGFLVAFTQLIPEHQVQILGSLRIRVKTLPGIYLLLSNVLIIFVSPSPWMLVQFGFPVSWAYLRFFKLSEDGLVRGDRSETFAFQYWFPPPVRPYIAAVGNQVFKVAVKARVVQAWDEPVSYQLLPGPGGARAEAERRRALALKALDARMASTSPAPASAAAPGAAGAPSTTASATVAVAGRTSADAPAAAAAEGASAAVAAAEAATDAALGAVPKKDETKKDKDEKVKVKD